MINCTRIDARGHNKNNGNMFDYMLATERLAIDSAVAYYAGSGPDPRQTLNWGGKLAAELDLEDQPVTRRVMELLARAFHPPEGRCAKTRERSPNWSSRRIAWATCDWTTMASQWRSGRAAIGSGLI